MVYVKWQCNCRYILYIDMMVTVVCVMGKTWLFVVWKDWFWFALYLNIYWTAPNFKTLWFVNIMLELFVTNLVNLLVSVQQLLEWSLTTWGLRLYVLGLLCLSGVTDVSASTKQNKIKITLFLEDSGCCTACTKSVYCFLPNAKGKNETGKCRI